MRYSELHKLEASLIVGIGVSWASDENIKRKYTSKSQSCKRMPARERTHAHTQTP